MKIVNMPPMPDFVLQGHDTVNFAVGNSRTMSIAFPNIKTIIYQNGVILFDKVFNHNNKYTWFVADKSLTRKITNLKSLITKIEQAEDSDEASCFSCCCPTLWELKQMKSDQIRKLLSSLTPYFSAM